MQRIPVRNRGSRPALQQRGTVFPTSGTAVKFTMNPVGQPILQSAPDDGARAPAGAAPEQADAEQPSAPKGAGVPKNDFFREEADVSLIGAEHPHLVSAEIKRFIENVHPFVPAKNKEGKTVYVRRRLCATNTGRIRLCPEQCGDDSDAGDLIQYGLGIMLFFKFLKAMASVFFVMSLMALPIMALYGVGEGRTDSREGLISTFVKFSPANLASASYECTTADAWGSSTSASSSSADRSASAATNAAGDTTTDDQEGYGSAVVTCPAGTVITAVEAMFGTNKGACECPDRRLPVAGQCPGQRASFSACQEGTYCFASQQRDVSTAGGLRFKAGQCCAAGRDSVGTPLFPELDFAPADGCDSFLEASLHVAQMRCMNEPSCSVSANPDALQAWAENAATGKACSASEKAAAQAAGLAIDGAATTCAARLSGPFRNASCSLSAAEAGAAYFDDRLVLVAQCEDVDVDVEGYFSLSKTDVAVIVAVADLVIALTFLFTWALLSRRGADQKFLLRMATPSDYTVMFQDLPPHKSLQQFERDLRAHLQTHLLEEDLQLVKSLTAVRIADVNSAVDMQQLGHEKLEFGKVGAAMVRTATRMVALGYSWEELQAAPEFVELQQADNLPLALTICNGLLAPLLASEEQRLSAEMLRGVNALERQQKRIKRLQEKTRASQATKVFVTFEDEEAVHRALLAFPKSRCYGSCCAPSAAKFKVTEQGGQVTEYPLFATRSPEPDDIIWENVPYDGSWESIGRRVGSLLVLLLVLLVAGASILAMERTRTRALASHPTPDCALLEPAQTDKAAAVMDAYYSEFGLAGGDTGRMGCFCQALWNEGGVVAMRGEPFPVPTSPEAAAMAPRVMNSSLATSTGVKALEALANPKSLPEGWEARYGCSDWFTEYVQLLGYTYSVSVVIVVINLSLYFLIQFLVKMERHSFKTEAIESRAVKLFIAQFIVTAVMTILINARIKGSGFWAEIFQGTFSDFTADWYVAVGASLCLTMLMQIVFPHLTPLQLATIKWAQRLYDSGCSCSRDIRFTRVSTQVELNELYAGPDMPVDETYGVVMNTVFVCFAFAAGMPLLLVICALALFIMYWAQKLWMLRLYKTPPMLDEALPRRLTSLLPAALVLHLGSAIWMLTSQDVFPARRSVSANEAQLSTGVSGDLDNSVNAAWTWVDGSLSSVAGSGGWGRVTQVHVLPLTILLVLVLLYFFLSATVGTLMGLVWRSLCACVSSERVHFEDLRSYFDALPTKLLDDFRNHRYEPKASLRPKYQKAARRREKDAKSYVKAKRLHKQARSRLLTAERELQAAQGRLGVAPERMDWLIQRRDAEKAETDKLRSKQLQLRRILAARGEQVKSTDEAGSGPAADLVLSGRLHSFDIDDNMEYQAQFGYSAYRTIRAMDAGLGRYLRDKLPHRASGEGAHVLPGLQGPHTSGSPRRAQMAVPRGHRYSMSDASGLAVHQQRLSTPPPARLQGRYSMAAAPSPAASSRLGHGPAAGIQAMPAMRSPAPGAAGVSPATRGGSPYTGSPEQFGNWHPGRPSIVSPMAIDAFDDTPVHGSHAQRWRSPLSRTGASASAVTGDSIDIGLPSPERRAASAGIDPGMAAAVGVLGANAVTERFEDEEEDEEDNGFGGELAEGASARGRLDRSLSMEYRSDGSTTPGSDEDAPVATFQPVGSISNGSIRHSQSAAVGRSLRCGGGRMAAAGQQGGEEAAGGWSARSSPGPSRAGLSGEAVAAPAAATAQAVDDDDIGRMAEEASTSEGEEEDGGEGESVAWTQNGTPRPESSASSDHWGDSDLMRLAAMQSTMGQR